MNEFMNKQQYFLENMKEHLVEFFIHGVLEMSRIKD